MGQDITATLVRLLRNDERFAAIRMYREMTGAPTLRQAARKVAALALRRDVRLPVHRSPRRVPPPVPLSRIDPEARGSFSADRVDSAIRQGWTASDRRCPNCESPLVPYLNLVLCFDCESEFLPLPSTCPTCGGLLHLAARRCGRCEWVVPTSELRPFERAWISGVRRAR